MHQFRKIRNYWKMKSLTEVLIQKKLNGEWRTYHCKSQLSCFLEFSFHSKITADWYERQGTIWNRSTSMDIAKSSEKMRRLPGSDLINTFTEEVLLIHLLSKNKVKTFDVMFLIQKLPTSIFIPLQNRNFYKTLTINWSLLHCSSMIGRIYHRTWYFQS